MENEIKENDIYCNDCINPKVQCLCEPKQPESFEGFFKNQLTLSHLIESDVPQGFESCDCSINKEYLISMFKEYATQQKQVSDYDIRTEAWWRFGEKTKGLTQLKRERERKSFVKGAKWMREQLNK